MKNNHIERGQALIVIALVAVALVGMVGLVVDGGRGFLDRRKAQNAADAAALASAYARIKRDQDMVTAAMAVAARKWIQQRWDEKCCGALQPTQKWSTLGRC